MTDVTLIQGDCLVEMPKLPSASFDMICADLPYGTTACSWDVVIPFEPLWAEYKRLIKPRGAVVLFGSQPFTSLLVTSNLDWFRYEWVWYKSRNSNPFLANLQPLRHHENIVVFGGDLYNPQMIYDRLGHVVNNGSGRVASENAGDKWNGVSETSYEKYPKSVIGFSNPSMAGMEHPTQKPVALLEYLIRTYTNEGDAVLDNTMGSGTAMVACVKTGRRGTGIELRQDYFAIAQRRIAEAQMQPRLFDDRQPRHETMPLFGEP